MNSNRHSLLSALDKVVESIKKTITKAHEDYAVKTVLFEARNYASKNLPHPGDLSIEPYVISFRGFYDGLKREVSLHLDGGIQHILNAINVTTLNEKIVHLKETLSVDQEKMRQLESDKERIHLTKSYDLYNKYRWILVLLGAGECGWTSVSFLHIGDTYLAAAIVGIIVGISQILAVKAIVQLFKDTDDRQKATRRFYLASIGLMIFSFLLGMLRYWTAHEGSGSGIPFYIINPFVFMFINLLILSATGLVVYLYYPSRSELVSFNQRDKIEKELDKLRASITIQGIEYKALLMQRDDIAVLRTTQKNKEKLLNEKVDKFYQEALGAYVHENVNKRSDGQFPQCFKAAINPLSSFDQDQPPQIE